MNVNKNQTPIVIGIDHGYGNIKTASSCFRTNVKAYDTEPTFTSGRNFTSISSAQRSSPKALRRWQDSLALFAG